jgi:2-polyprenyl-3-methyl-5-hydroxy-6-metoxy-1,4-benzoquinol methylase
VYAEPLPDESIRALYSREYFEGRVYADYLGERDVIRRNAGRALAELVSLAPGRRLLDVGCAAGFFLEAARDQGWQVEGVELSEYASGHARDRLGLAVRTGPVAELSPDAGPFDAVTLWDCIEHLSRPDVDLSLLRRRMAPGGILMLSTGNYESLLRRVTGRRWRLFSDSTHNFFFSPATLGRLLTRAGFSVKSTSYRGKWVSLPMIVKQTPFLPGALRSTLGASLKGRSLYVNLRDVMTLTARAV